MKIWILGEKVDEYKNLAFVDRTQSKMLLNQFDGRRMINSWTPLEVRFIDDDRGLKIGDAANLYIANPVINAKSVSILNKFLSGAVEILPLKHETIDYYILNVINVIDCLDLEKSEFERFPDSGEIMWCNKYVFLKEKVDDQHIFKIPQTIRGRVLVSDEFRDRVLSSGLEGYDFKEVWDSENKT